MKSKALLILLSATIAFCACQQEGAEAGVVGKEQIDMQPNPWQNAGCELITDEEVIRLFHFEPQSAILNSRTLPEKSFCLRTWMKPDWREREANNEQPGKPFLEPRNTLVIQVLDYGSAETAREQVTMLRNSRRDQYDTDVQGIGDDALWSTATKTILVLRGRLVLNITLDHADAPKDNLPKAKELALIAVSKM